MDALLHAAGATESLALYGREAVKEELRRAVAAGETRAEKLWAAAREALARRFAPTLVHAINGTGVLLHTNLGRAPLADSARAALAEAAAEPEGTASCHCADRSGSLFREFAPNARYGGDRRHG